MYRSPKVGPYLMTVFLRIDILDKEMLGFASFAVGGRCLGLDDKPFGTALLDVFGCFVGGY